MLALSDLKRNQCLTGLDHAAVATVVAVNPFSPDAVQVVYKLPDGSFRERLLTPGDEATLAIAIAGRPWDFDGDAAAFQLVCEAKRIELAHLFDPMTAVHTSNVEPLPHQITAVYESMLPRQPLRYVLADDPGAGKTVMAGLYIRELVVRADARRILVVAPGSLVEQWRDELRDKFGLDFAIYSPQLDESAPGGDAFDGHNQLIVRLDQVTRNEELQDRVCRLGWDLVVFDEAHKLAAHYFGSEDKKTGRYKFAEKIGRETRHLLLMTATPHNGKEEDYQLFLRLLDSDRFYGKFRGETQEADASDLMRRMVKEQLVRFDGTPLFPERKAYTVNYELSPAEADLYEAVTRYVQTEMGKADLLRGPRKGSVGFALTALQRRLASSPAAIHRSLTRRRDRLDARLRDGNTNHADAEVPEDDDDLTADEQEDLEANLVDQATAARTADELRAELLILNDLEKRAAAVVASGTDCKWEQLSSLLQNTPEMRDADGQRRKLIIFSEHRDTLEYLRGKVSGVIGDAEAVVTIHGGTPRQRRIDTQSEFRNNPAVRVLIATDAAGEGVNLQVAHLMVNYDLPWNPNRLEQRFGRIHRIKQESVCHLWNLVAKDTREGAVYFRLLEKIRIESAALNGRVFDILGRLFEGISLKDMLVEAIRYNDSPEVQAKLGQQVEHPFDHDHLRKLVDTNALAHEALTPERLYAVKEQMDRAEARRLQPYFVRTFFLSAFAHLGGSIHRREAGRHEITQVPSALRDRPGNPRPGTERVQRCYERVAFTKDALQPAGRPDLRLAELLHPGHPLMAAVTGHLLDSHANLLRQGATLMDPADDGAEPSVLVLLSHDVKDAAGRPLSQRVQFVRLRPDGTAAFAGWAPHLDLEPLPEADRARVADLVAAPWLAGGLEARAVGHAAAHIAPEHFAEVAGRRVAHVEKTLRAVHERLTNEIKYLTGRWEKWLDDRDAGKDVRLNLENAERTLKELQTRLDSRKAELNAMRTVVSGTPVVLGAALVVPAGLLRQLRGEAQAESSADAAARKRVEMLAMDCVRKAEEAAGCRVVDVSADKCGWDLTSQPPAVNGIVPEVRHIEVKGRAKGSDTVTVTRNEILYALNQGGKFLLALVFVGVDDGVDGPYYVRKPFERELDSGAVAVDYSIPALLAKAAHDDFARARAQKAH